jgi:lipopolysaccharide export system protein LptC
MALLVLMLIGWIAARAVLTALNQARGAGAAIHMSDAVFHGRSETGKPFRLTAREAARDGVNPDQILLTAPIMEIAAGDGVGARRMTADNGVYHDNDKMLYMSGHVTVDDGQGTLFHSDRAVIDIDKDAAFGDTRVVGDGPQGHIEADSYRVDQKGRRVVFDGKVHGRFLPQKEQEQ